MMIIDLDFKNTGFSKANVKKGLERSEDYLERISFVIGELNKATSVFVVSKSEWSSRAVIKDLERIIGSMYKNYTINLSNKTISVDGLGEVRFIHGIDVHDVAYKMKGFKNRVAVFIDG